MKLSRRTFNSSLFGSLLTFALVKSLDKVNVLAHPVEPIVRKWLIEMEQVTEQLRQGKVETIAWQNQIESLLSRVDLNDLLSAIDYERLAKTAVFPEDHESAEDVDFSHNQGLPAELSFAPYFYAMKRGTAIVPHGHRNMTSMHMMIKGQAHGWQFERVSDDAQYVTMKPTNDRVLEVGAVTTVSEQRDNIHWFKALSEPVFMFNIGVFRINPAKDFSGRDYVDPLGGEKLKDGLIRARRLEVKEAYQLYGKS
ncbi:MAG TPA: hypothetical protein VGO68_16360 [Pyrinomonadaceae bacterium]|jgi:hypothetical protein|nr:hypothetical protein [Pyrinomonadaceae bacterium]